MKKALLVFLVLISFMLLGAEVRNILNLSSEQLTQDVLKQIQADNSGVRNSLRFNYTTFPYPLPDGGVVFKQYESYTKDFLPNLLPADYVGDYVWYWTSSSQISIETVPGSPTSLKFTALDPYWYGTETVAITIADHILAQGEIGYTWVFEITVSNTLDPPRFNDQFTAPGGVVFEMEEKQPSTPFEPLTIDFRSNAPDGKPWVRSLDSASNNFLLYITALGTDITFEQFAANGTTPSFTGPIVKFTPTTNFNGLNNFLVMAKDPMHTSAQIAANPDINFTPSRSFSVRVTPLNDPPVINSVELDGVVAGANIGPFAQGSTHEFEVFASDIDAGDTLYYSWYLTGIGGEVLLVDRSLNPVFNYNYAVPGFYTLRLVVKDRLGVGAGYVAQREWNLTVSPLGPQFDPWGGTFSSTTNVQLSAPGAIGATLYYSLIDAPYDWVEYTAPIVLSVPPQDYTQTIWAKYILPDALESVVQSQTYVMTGTVAIPVFDHFSGEYPPNDPTTPYGNNFKLGLSCATAGVTIQYSEDNGLNWVDYDPVSMIDIAPQTHKDFIARATKVDWISSANTDEHSYTIRRKVNFPAPDLDTVPDPDLDGFYCVCFGDSVKLEFSNIVPDPINATIWYTIQEGVDVFGPFEYDPLDPAIYYVEKSALVKWWAAYDDGVYPYFDSDIHEYSIPIKNRTRMTFWADDNQTVFNPIPIHDPDGFYMPTQSISINTTTYPAGADIMYRIKRFGDADWGAWQVYDMAIDADSDIWIEAYAVALPPATTLNTLVQSAYYTITGTLPSPLISVNGGAYGTISNSGDTYPGNPTIRFEMPVGVRWQDAAIWWSEDDGATYQLYNPLAPPVLLQGHKKVRAYAVKNLWVDSVPDEMAEFYIKFLPPITFTTNQEPLYIPNPAVNLSEHYGLPIEMTPTIYGGSTIRYSIGDQFGNPPLDVTPASVPYVAGVPIVLNNLAGTPFQTMIKARAYQDGWIDSEQLEWTFSYVPKMSVPIFTPVDDTHEVSVEVSLHADEALAPYQIYYILDPAHDDVPGPDNPNSVLYDGSFNIGSTRLIVARAYKAGYQPSDLVYKTYFISNTIGTLRFTPPQGTYTTSLSVGISTVPTEAQISYSLNNVDWQPFVNPIDIPLGTMQQIWAKAELAGWLTQFGTAVYHTLQAPQISPEQTEYPAGSVVSVDITAPHGDVSYRINGGNWELAPLSFDITSNSLIEARVSLNGVDTQIVSKNYVFNNQLGMPFASLPGDIIYFDPISVVLGSAQGANIFYSLNGVDYLPYVIGDLLDFGVSGTLYAYAQKPNYPQSGTRIWNYELKVRNPILSLPHNSSYAGATQLSMMVNTDGASIYYTTDPALAFSVDTWTLYSTPIMVNSSATYRVIAIKPGWTPSDIRSYTYTINGAVVALMFNPPADTYFANQNVLISTTTPGATIYYSTDGSYPSVLYNNLAITITENTLLRARAVKENWIPTAEKAGQYYLQVRAVTDGGIPAIQNGEFDLFLFTPTNADATIASIFYGLNGAPPNIPYDPVNGIHITATTTVRAIAKHNTLDWLDSPVFERTYVISPQVATPQIVPGGGVFNNIPVLVTINPVPGANLWYRLGIVGAWLPYVDGTQIPVNSNTLVQAKATRNDWIDSEIAFAQFVIELNKVATPTFDPEPGLKYSATDVTIDCDTDGAEIRYTINDGPEIVYNGGSISVAVTSTIKAKAYKNGMATSDEAIGVYTITGRVQLAANVFSLDPAPFYATPQAVTLDVNTTPAGALLRYTLDGSVPNELSPAYLPGFEIPITSSMTISVIGFYNNWLPSVMQTATYQITGQVVMGAIAPDASVKYNNPVEITITNPSPVGANVFYSTDGSNPVNGVNEYSASFTVDANDVIDGSSIVQVKAQAFLNQWTDSDIVARTYMFKAAAPEFNRQSGVYSSARWLKLTSVTTNAVIRYTTDGTDPNLGSTVFEDSLLINQSVTVKAIAFNRDYEPSNIVSATYVIGSNEVVALPVFNPQPQAAPFTTAQSVTISCSTADATIYYTLNGSDPRLPESNALVYAGGVIPIGVESTVTIKAYATVAGLIPSQVATGTYVVTNKVQDVVFSHPEGTYTSVIQVVLTCPTDGSYIRYSTDDGNTWQTYTTAILIAENSSLRITAQAFKDGWANSDPVTLNYTVTGTTGFIGQMLTPLPGTYNNEQTILLSPTYPAGAEVYYTIDGSDPLTSATRILYDYNNPGIVIDGGVDPNVFLVDLQVAVVMPGGWVNQVFDNNIYHFRAANPTYTPEPGGYSNAINVSISSATTGASIYYNRNAVDDANPTFASDVYTVPINVAGDSKFKAFAWKSGYEASLIITGYYDIDGGSGTPRVVKPVFFPAANTFTSAQSVTISTTTAAATIRYTLDGTAPTRLNGFTYDGNPISLGVETVTTIRAFAFRDGYLDSNEEIGTYTITNKVADVVFDPIGGNFANSTQVSLSCATENAIIRYTTNGQVPDENSQAYAAPILIPGNSLGFTIMARAYRTDWAPSALGTEVYNTTGALAFDPPIMNPASGIINGAINVVIPPVVPVSATLTEVYYTTDGSAPSSINGTLYTAPIWLDGNVTATNTQIRAIALRAGWVSATMNGVYSFKAPTPSLDPAPGAYPVAQNIFITNVAPGFTARFTTDGSTPSTIHGTIYTGAAILVNVNQTIRVVMYKDNYLVSDLVEAPYTIGISRPVVANPIYNPPSTSSFAPIIVTITSSTENAQIRYTIDGSDPTPTHGIVYSGQITVPLNTNRFFKAIAYREGHDNSAIVAANYVVTGKVQPVVFSPEGGTFQTAQSVVLNTLTDGAIIYYTTNGTEPTIASTRYTMPINIPLNSSRTLRAKAFKEGWDASDTSPVHVYNVTGQIAFEQPIFSPVPGTFSNQASVTIAEPIPSDAIVYYTIDGSVPVPGNPNTFIYNNVPIQISQATILKAIAVSPGWQPSEVISGDYLFKAANPTFSIPGGWYESSQIVTLSTSTPGAFIRFTTDGSIPTAENGQLYVNPIPVGLNQTIRAYAYKVGYQNSDVVSNTYAIGSYVPIVATPVFNLLSGTYQTQQSVIISVSTPNAMIRYTTDGTDPSELLGTVFTTPIPVANTTTIKAIAYKADWQNSQIVTANYTITGKVPAVQFSHDPSVIYTNPINVVLTSALQGVYFRYTLDGTDPTDNSPLYTTAIQIPLNSSVTIKARGYKTDWTPSDVYTASYTVTGQVVIPGDVFTLASMTYTTPQSVSIMNPVPSDAQIRYTMDGTEPLDTSILYDGNPISLPMPANTTLRVKAFKIGWLDSPEYTISYNLTGQVGLQAISFDPPSGTYQTPQIVHLIGNSTPSGAILRYTVNGGEPNELSPAYNPEIGIAINGSAILRVKGFYPGWISSSTILASYTITGQVAFTSTVFNPSPGTYATEKTITLGNTYPSSAIVRYTTNGDEPTIASAVFPNSLNLDLNTVTTLKVKAFLENWTPSATHTATFVITGQVSIASPVFTPETPTHTSPINVVINQVTNPVGAVIRYTTDGSDPHEGSAIYTEPISVGANQVMTIRTRAFFPEWTPSVVYSASYNVTGTASIAGVAFAPDPGIVYTTPQTVVISTNTIPIGATIRYTTDGTEPGETSPVYSIPIQIGLNSSTTIKAKVFNLGWITSPTYTATYTVTGQVNVAAISLTPIPAVYQSLQAISVSGTPVPSDAVLRYTTDGTDPVDSSPVFTTLNPPLNSALNLKVRGFRENWIPSVVISGQYLFTGKVQISQTLFSHPTGTYSSSISVTLDTTTNPLGATLRYTIDGSEPTLNSPAYSAPIVPAMNATTTVKVKGFATDWTASDTQTAVYTMTGALDIAIPRFTPAAGIYTTAQQITLGNPIIMGTATPAVGAQIRYTTNGDEPTATSALYTEAISLPLDSTTTLKIKSFKADWIASPTYQALYQITGQAGINGLVFTPTPNPSPNATYTTAQNVQISTNVYPSNAVVRYTIDGTTPTISSDIYTGEINVPLNTHVIIRARAFADNWLPSVVYTGEYRVTGKVEFQTPTAVFAPVSGIYTSAQIVTINTSTTPLGSTIRYTVDGSTPDATSTVYAGGIPIGLNTTTTIKAIALADGWIASDVYEATYTVTGQVSFANTTESPVFTPAAGIYQASVQVLLGAIIQSDASIYYTLDGSDPTEASTLYDTSIDLTQLNSVYTLKVRAYKQNWIPSIVHEAVYTLTGKVELPTPMFTPAAGIYQAAQTVTLNTATTPGDADIRYTVNGADPTLQSQAYNPAIGISLPLNSGISLIKVRAFKTNWIESDVVSAEYKVTGTLASPIFSHEGGLYAQDFYVKISTSDADAVIRYSVDGTDVTASSPVYADSISISGLIVDGLTVKAKVFKQDWISSQQVSHTYRLLLLPLNIRTITNVGYVRVLWNTPELPRALDGFNIYRMASNEAVFTKKNATLIPVSQKIGADHYWDDYDISNNMTYQYYVTAVYNGQESIQSSITSAEYQSPILEITDSSRVYPNPAESSTTFQVRLSRNDNVNITVEIYDFAGKKLRTLNSANLSTNLVNIAWDLKNDSGKKVARGTYFARVVANDSSNRSEKIIKISVK